MFRLHSSATQSQATQSQASLEADEAGSSMMICLRGTRSRPTGAHQASEGRTVSAGLPALLEAASRVVPFIVCAIGISCARSCIVQCPISDARSPRMQPAPIAMGSKVNAKFSMLCLLRADF